MNVDDPKVVPIDLVQRTQRKVRKPRPAQTEVDADPGVIKLGTDIHRVVDECSSALLRCEDLFCRSGELVRVVRDAAPPPNVRRPAGAPTIRSVAIPTLLEELTRVQTFVKFDRREAKWVTAVPNAATLAALSARGAWAGLRPLVGIIEAPALRPDGTIIQTPGYDPATSYLYEPSAEFPEIADHPTKDDAIAARDELLEVVADFPFATEEHRSAWLAFALTLFARPAIDGSLPIVLADATTQGTGKGRLIDATAIIQTGREATKTPLPQDDEEMRKRITSLLVEGERLSVLDNVNQEIALPSLEAAITATIWRDRILGRNGTVTVPNLMMWAASGNNLTISSDLARRSLHIRLESRVENPENRSDFKHHPLLPWVLQERPRLVVAALTILRAHAIAGRPACGVKPWGSFESWSAVVASAVVWTDMPDPQATRVALTDSSDTTRTAARALIEGWARLAPTGLTVRSAIDLLYPVARLRGEHVDPDGFEDMRNAIEELVTTQPGKPPSHTKLGQRMRSFRRRLIGGRMLDGSPDRKGVVVWTVKSAGDAGKAGDSTTLRAGDGSHEKYNSGDTGGRDPGNTGNPGTDHPLTDLLEGRQ